MNSNDRSLNRREFLHRSALAAGSVAALGALPLSAQPKIPHPGADVHAPLAPDALHRADVIELTVGRTSLVIDGRSASAVTVNGTLPAPLIRLREGDTAVLRVTNTLREDTSIHWHGIILPNAMDGVPMVTFPGIAPGETFTYEFPVRQSGTYWYHSHSGMQEQLGMYGPMVIEPAKSRDVAYDRDYVVLLSDWTFEDPHRLTAKLKKMGGYYNFQRRTLLDLFRKGDAGLADRAMWSRMRMDPTDIADVTGNTYTYLLNGRTPASPWTGAFRPGERVRLRLINSGAATYFDIRIPGLEMTVIQADGQDVVPTTVDELRIAIAETYDVIVHPTGDRAYALFAETMDRSGFALGTLAPRDGMTAPVPERRRRPLRSMTDMGMSHGATAGAMAAAMAGMAGMEHAGHARPASDAGASVPHGADRHGPGNSMTPEVTQARLGEAGVGLGGDNRRVLVYRDLRSAAPTGAERDPDREIELHLTGNMERFLWSFDGKKYSDARTPIAMRMGERVRLTFVNDTMMEHPIHLHGMWMILENGAGNLRPRKHTINVKPAERVSVIAEPDVPGKWALHCHIMVHMDAGMFRVVEVSSAAS